MKTRVSLKYFANSASVTVLMSVFPQCQRLHKSSNWPHTSTKTTDETHAKGHYRVIVRVNILECLT